jgi:hypothetical protein
MSWGSTMAAMIFKRQPQRGHCSMSISNTRLSKHPQLCTGALRRATWAW